MKQILGLAIFILAFGAMAQNQRTVDAAISTLRVAQPKVSWVAKTVVSADVTCDGKADTAIVGYGKNIAVWLGVVSVDNKKPVTMKFLVGKNSQDSFSSVPVNILTHTIDCEDAEGGTLPGCKKIKGCSGFSLSDDSSDSFHFYWDSTRKKLTWWRL